MITLKHISDENNKAGNRAEAGTYHSGELGISAVGAGLAMAAETGHFGEVETEFALQPVDSVTRSSGENLNEVVTG